MSFVSVMDFDNLYQRFRNHRALTTSNEYHLSKDAFISRIEGQLEDWAETYGYCDATDVVDPSHTYIGLFTSDEMLFLIDELDAH